jgi:hypothetical protein
MVKCLVGVKKTKRELVITGISAEIRSRYLPNISITTSVTSIGNTCSARLLVYRPRQEQQLDQSAILECEWGCYVVSLHLKLRKVFLVCSTAVLTAKLAKERGNIRSEGGEKFF